jgi:hypothetical protein
VHELGDHAGADRADIGGLVAHRVERRFAAVEDLLVAAGPDRHLAAGRGAWAAADRRLERAAGRAVRPTAAAVEAMASFAVIRSAMRTGFDSGAAWA